MEAGWIVLVVLSLFLGFAIGIFLGVSIVKRRYASDMCGVLNVDCSDPEVQPGLWLQLDVQIEDVINKSQATFDINVIRPISQK